MHIQKAAVVGSNPVVAAGGDVDAVAAASVFWLQRARLLTNATTAARQPELQKSTLLPKADMAAASMHEGALVEKAEHGMQEHISMALKGLGCQGVEGFSTKDQHIRRHAAKQQQQQKAPASKC